MVSAHYSRTSRSRLYLQPSRHSAETSYRSFQFGYTVTWKYPWAVTDGDGSDDVLPEPGTERSVLGMQDHRHTLLRIVGADRRNVLNPVETVRFWTSPEYISDYMEPGTKVVLTDRAPTQGGVVMVSPGPDSGTPIVTVMESYDVGIHGSIRTSFTSDIDTVHDAWVSMQQHVQIEHRLPMRCFDTDVLMAVLS